MLITSTEWLIPWEVEHPSEIEVSKFLHRKSNSLRAFKEVVADFVGYLWTLKIRYWAEQPTRRMNVKMEKNQELISINY